MDGRVSDTVKRAEEMLAGVTQLTEREKWLMREAFIAGWDAGELRDPNRGMDDWLADIPDNMTVESVLVQKAPTDSRVRQLCEEVQRLEEENERLRKRDGNARIVLCSSTPEDPFNQEDVKIIDFGVSDNVYMVESVELTTLRDVVEDVRKEAQRMMRSGETFTERCSGNTILAITTLDEKQSLCDTCRKADVSCPIYPQETQTCVEYAEVKK